MARPGTPKQFHRHLAPAYQGWLEKYMAIYENCLERPQKLGFKDPKSGFHQDKLGVLCEKVGFLLVFT